MSLINMVLPEYSILIDLFITKKSVVSTIRLISTYLSCQNVKYVHHIYLVY